MYHLYGYEEVIRSVYRACRAGQTSSISNIDQLRQCYLKSLEDRGAPQRDAADRFVSDAEVETRLSKFFSGTDRGDRDQRSVMGPAYPADVRQARLEFARNALDGVLNRDDDLRAVFELVIHSIFVRAHSDTAICHGGSSSAAIGVIWLSVDSLLTERDISELFIHELTHHLVYIDELSNAQFIYDEMFEANNFVSSAILKKSKSVSKVVHSMIVGIEICMWRQRFATSEPTSVHPSSQRILAGIQDSHESIVTLPRFEALTTPHLREVLARVMSECQNIEVALRESEHSSHRTLSGSPVKV